MPLAHNLDRVVLGQGPGINCRGRMSWGWVLSISCRAYGTNLVALGKVAGVMGQRYNRELDIHLSDG